jgi:hypothetical protein
MLPCNLRRICDGMDMATTPPTLSVLTRSFGDWRATTRERRSRMGEVAANHQSSEFAL